MNTKIKQIKVSYNNSCVGYLNQLNENTISFKYDSEWLKNGFSISPLSLPLKNEIFISKNFHLKGLFGVFWDCLPQGWGNRVLQKALRKKEFDYSEFSLLTKLSLQSDNPRGALRFDPVQFQYKESKKVDLDKLNFSAIKITSDEPLTKEDELLVYYSSNVGGAKPKVNLTIDNEEWIIKLIANSSDSGVEEYKANELAKACDIKTNEFKLFKSKSNKYYFGSKRFDVDSNNKPIHMITLCGLLETTPAIPNLDYYNLFQVINLISVNKLEDKYEAFKRMVFNVLYGNKDDHGCNWSFLYNETLKGYVLSPFYDITYTSEIYPEHEMSVLSNGNPSVKDMLELAKQFNLSIDKCKKIINHIQSVLKINHIN